MAKRTVSKPVDLLNIVDPAAISTNLETYPFTTLRSELSA